MIEIKAKDLNQGEEFSYSGRKFIALGWEQKGILAVAKEPIKHIPFDKKAVSNDWRKSSLREYLNGTFLEEEFDPTGLLRFTSDLTADDGLTDYGKSVDLVFLLSDDLYRKYRYFMPKYWNACVWLITPWSCLPSCSGIVRYVLTDGSLYGGSVACRDFAAAVACLFNPESVVICDDRRSKGTDITPAGRDEKKEEQR